MRCKKQAELLQTGAVKSPILYHYRRQACKFFDSSNLKIYTSNPLYPSSPGLGARSAEARGQPPGLPLKARPLRLPGISGALQARAPGLESKMSVESMDQYA
jgi:hypothetical protein